MRLGPAANGFRTRNLIDLKRLFGHRNRVPGFHEALRQRDAATSGPLSASREDDLLFVTADHGIDPTTTSDDHQDRMLRERAMAAMERAYAPYSHFQVGAALLGGDGSISEACNVENAAFPAGTCAERAALAVAVARGVRTFRTLVVATSAAEPTPPCGLCRQALIEFAPQLEIVSVTKSGARARWLLSELLPHAFTTRSLDQQTE